METIRPNDNFFMRHATPVAIATLTILMMVVAAMFWRQEQATSEAKGWVLHTYEVINHLESLFSKLKDAQLGQRGYLITGDEAYLEPYQEAMRDVAPANTQNFNTSPQTTSANSFLQRRSVTQEIAYIQKITSDNPVQQSNVEELTETSQKLLDYLTTSIHARQSQGNKTTGSQPDLHRGKELMDHVRSMMRIMESEETHLLALRTEADELNTQENERMTFSGLALFYIVMVLSIWLYQTTRARAQAQLLLYTHELERNEEELKMQQEELRASNEEIETSNEALEEKTRMLEAQNAYIQHQSEEIAESQKLVEEKAREMERASTYKSEFLANMSHELRTPLNSLLILSKLLAANEQGNLTQEQVEEALIIYNGGLDLLGLINDILDLSKVEAGKLTITPYDIGLDNIISRMQQQFIPIAKEKNVAFLVKLAEDLPATIRTDAQRVEQILKNLLSNAFKFTEHGSVTLEIRHPEKAEMQRASADYSHAIAFSVMDTGIGIEPTKFKDIFEAFQQEDGSIDRNYGGTGLGLTIARKFATMLGGEIHIASTKGKGSRFTLVLPIQSAGGQPAAEAEVGMEGVMENFHPDIQIPPAIVETKFVADDRNNISGDDKVLLIIEDDPVFAKILIKMAHKHGYKCLAAGNGKSGLLLATQQSVAAIILDLTLPDIDGMDVLERLKHNLNTRHIPVHIISGREEDNALPLKKGAIGYLVKPVEKEAIEGVFGRIEDMLHSEIKQILVIEDDKKTQIAIQSLLKKKDVHITVVGTGSAGLEYIKKTRFDCIILDLHLSDMTGFEWLQNAEIDSNENTLSPVIVYTAKELTEEENRQLLHYTGSIIIKGAKSPERLFDEVTLFLHSVQSTLSSDQQKIIHMQHNPDEVLQGRTVLLADDDMRNTFALSKVLKKHGMQVVIADNGQMALEKLQTDASIELVLMDIMMPVMDGYQAMHEIRARTALRKLPIIALTARAMPEEQKKCMAAGANDYLTKPVDIERLIALLRVWLFKQERVAS